MGMLRFLSRVAFICNCCFLLLSFSQWLPHPLENALTGDVLFLGWMGAFYVNIFICIILLILLLIGRLRKVGIPAWLLIVNFLFFAVQLTIIYLNHNLK
jgi:hypothetical protein